MKMSVDCIPGCVFEHCGQVPEYVYNVDTFTSPLEEAVYTNNMELFNKLIKEGQKVTVKLRIGMMSCLEYAAMRGYVDILTALIENSSNATILKKYFALDDVVDRAYLISKHKGIFFGQEALAEANRYEAALYTAVEYNQPKCVDLMLTYLGPRDSPRQTFYTQQAEEGGVKVDKLSALELAKVRGHHECSEVISKRRTMSE